MGPRLIAHDVLDSANAEALRLARGGERGPLWITARRQTAGHGRRGRSWISAPGNLHATLLHALGLNHLQLTYPHEGRQDTLTDAPVSDAIVQKALLA